MKISYDSNMAVVVLSCCLFQRPVWATRGRRDPCRPDVDCGARRVGPSCLHSFRPQHHDSLYLAHHTPIALAPSLQTHIFNSTHTYNPTWPSPAQASPRATTVRPRRRSHAMSKQQPTRTQLTATRVRTPHRHCPRALERRDHRSAAGRHQEGAEGSGRQGREHCHAERTW
jgi:hypothetical protein